MKQVPSSAFLALWDYPGWFNLIVFQYRFDTTEYFKQFHVLLYSFADMFCHSFVYWIVRFSTRKILCDNLVNLIMIIILEKKN